MKKLVEGILEFRRSVFPAYRRTFARLARSQAPDCLFVACSDSCVPNLFASTQPGDLFVVRNVGNLFPPAAVGDPPRRGASPGAALEFAVLDLEVSDIVVCGHSSCGAMRALLAPESVQGAPHLASWLENGRASLERFRREGGFTPDLPEADQLSQVSAVTQLEHLATYPFVSERVEDGRLRLHAWWFDVGTADVHTWDPERQRFVAIDEEVAERLLRSVA